MKFNYLILGLVLLCKFTFGQGCSDAGFCSINSFKPKSIDSLNIVTNQIKAGAYFGRADRSISVFGNYLEYNRMINEKFGLDIKLTSLAQTDENISVFGLSDVFLNVNYKAVKKFNFTFGAKIPLNDGNKFLNSLPLPMDYQSSLGTFDLLFGINYSFKKTQLILAIQQPIIQNNNQFFANNYPEDSRLGSFQTTNNFKRNGDILFRISRPFLLTKKLKLTTSILSIYHLKNDEFNESEIITGSKGLTINSNVFLDYNINSNNIIQIIMGRPIVTRAKRPDGLTRQFILNMEYSFKF